MSSTDSPERPENRLDRELNEILDQARKRPVSFQDHVARKRNAVETRRHSSRQRLQELQRGPLRTAARWTIRIPLLTALVLAALAVWLTPDYRVLGGLLAVAAAVMIFVPFVLRRPNDEIEYPKRWRGRIVSGSPPASSSGPRSWLDSARDRLGR